MKKLLLLLFIFLSFYGFAQSSLAKEQFNNSTRYLIDNPCDATGLMWAKAAASNDENYSNYLNNILSNCDRFKYDKAIQILNEDSTSFKAQEYLTDLLSKKPNDEELNYLLAKISIDRSGGNHIAAKYISNAIQINPSNIEYRWIRFRSTPVHNRIEESLQLAKRDLEYIIENGKDNSKVNYYLGTVNNGLGDYWFYKPLSVDFSYNDSFDDQENEEKSNKIKALEYYKIAKLNFENSIEIEPRMKDKVQMKLLLNRIDEINITLTQI